MIDEIPQVIDVDGNTYRTVKIGSQLWLAENLKVTRYRNGDSITTRLIMESEWGTIEEGAYSNWIDQESYSATYGRLYNLYAVKDPRGLAPSGWHIAGDEEWQALIAFLGGGSTAGYKIKETGTTHWQDYHNNANSTNESGFTALPGGKRDANGNYSGLPTDAYFWSSTAHRWHLNGNSSTLEISNKGSRQDGYSVRCIKD